MTSYRQTLHRVLFATVAVASLGPLVRAQGRTEVTINDTGVQAENLTSSQDGSVYFGSTAKGTIYRAAPGAAQAEPWIQASASGLTLSDGNVSNRFSPDARDHITFADQDPSSPWVHIRSSPGYQVPSTSTSTSGRSAGG